MTLRRALWGQRNKTVGGVAMVSPPRSEAVRENLGARSIVPRGALDDVSAFRDERAQVIESRLPPLESLDHHVHQHDRLRDAQGPKERLIPLGLRAIAFEQR